MPLTPAGYLRGNMMVHAVPDCGFSRSYIVSGRDGLLAVDVGSVGAAEDLSDYIGSRPDMSLDMVKYIVSTHFHIDHIGGIGRFLAKCPGGTQVLFHSLVKDYLDGKRRISLITAWHSGFLPAALASFRRVRRISHLYFETPAGIPLPGIRNLTGLPYARRINYFGLPERRSLSEGNDAGGDGVDGRPSGGGSLPAVVRYPLDFGGWEIIESPGHTEDSVCFYNAASKELICGDLIVNVEKSGRGRLNRFCWNREAAAKSFESLRLSVKAEFIYPGHGDIISDEDDALPKVDVFSKG